MTKRNAVGQASGTICQFRIVKDITLVSASIRESVEFSLETFRPKVVVESGPSVERHAPSRINSRRRSRKEPTSRACLPAASPAPSASTSLDRSAASHARSSTSFLPIHIVAMTEVGGRRSFKVFGQEFIVDARYNVTKELGQGAYGIVWYVSFSNKVPEGRLTHATPVQHRPATIRKSR